VSLPSTPLTTLAAQFAPMYDPLGAVIGCFIFLIVVGTYVTGIVALIAAIRSRGDAALLAARICFLTAFALVVYFSYATFRSFLPPTPWFVIIAGVPAILAIVAWLVAITASRRETWLAPIVALTCAGIAAAAIHRDLDYRARRDALLIAARTGDISGIRALLATGLSPDLAGADTENLVVIAPNGATVNALAAAGARMNADPRALCWAAETGNLDKMRAMLAHGADPNARMGQRSPSLLAWWHHQDAALELLRRAGARDAESCQHAEGALIRAVKTGSAAALQHTLDGCYLDGEVPAALKLAAESGNVAMTSILIRMPMATADVEVAAARAHEPSTSKVLADELVRRKYWGR
jgi:hypothetical protein